MESGPLLGRYELHAYGLGHSTELAVTSYNGGFSGRHNFGFLTPGVTYHLTKHQVSVAGYKIPNHASDGQPGIVLEYGIIF